MNSLVETPDRSGTLYESIQNRICIEPNNIPSKDPYSNGNRTLAFRGLSQETGNERRSRTGHRTSFLSLSGASEPKKNNSGPHQS